MAEASLAHRRVLVVEDAADIRELLVEILESSGYDVVSAPDGAQALALLHKGARFDLVLLDLMLPVMDGIELLEQLREAGDLPAPVVAMSAFERFRKDSRDLGACAFVGKPVDVDHLLATIDRHAGRGASG